MARWTLPPEVSCFWHLAATSEGSGDVPHSQMVGHAIIAVCAGGLEVAARGRWRRRWADYLGRFEAKDLVRPGPFRHNL